MGETKSRVGLVLSGGGLRGFAHVGVLKALEARGWRPDLITGTSMGAIVGAAYASGMSIVQMEQESLELTRLSRVASLIDRRPRSNALIAGDRLFQYFRDKLGNATFNELKVPLGLLTVNCETGEEVALMEGDVALAVRAAMAFPGVFAPVQLGDLTLIDGGSSNNVPVSLARQMGADKVVAVDVLPRIGTCRPVESQDAGPSLVPTSGAMAIFQRGFDIVMATLTELRFREFPADVLLNPDVPTEVATFTGFAHISECIQAGEDAVRAHETELSTVFNR